MKMILYIDLGVKTISKWPTGKLFYFFGPSFPSSTAACCDVMQYCPFWFFRPFHSFLSPVPYVVCFLPLVILLSGITQLHRHRYCHFDYNINKCQSHILKLIGSRVKLYTRALLILYSRIILYTEHVIYKISYEVI